MDPVQLTVGILAEAFGEVPVLTEVPRDRPVRLVVASLLSAETDGLVTTALMGITCWGRDDHDAQTMATYAGEALMEAAETHPYLFSSSLESWSRDEWTSTGQARYFAQVRLTINTDE